MVGVDVGGTFMDIEVCDGKQFVIDMAQRLLSTGEKAPPRNTNRLIGKPIGTARRAWVERLYQSVGLWLSLTAKTKAIGMENKDNLQMLIRWRRNCFRSQIANYNCANRCANRNYCLGIPTVILSAIVATSVFAALGKTVELHIQITVGLVSVLAAVLAALQTFLKLDELASKHRSIAAEYGSVKRRLDQEVAKLRTGDEVVQQTVDSIRERMDTLSREGPVVPRDIWAKARTTAPTVDNTTAE